MFISQKQLQVVSIDDENCPSRFIWRRFVESDKAEILSWFKSRNALAYVSSEHGKELTEGILNSWINKSLDCLVLLETERDLPVGFLTLSNEEAPGLPYFAIELCHLIMKPSRDYCLVAAYLCYFAKSVAKYLGFSILLGRVVPENSFGLFLANSLGFKRFSSRDTWLLNEFIWFSYQLANPRCNNKGRY
jgi:hypothetical protein